jgi:hypothetical protein
MVAFPDGETPSPACREGALVTPSRNPGFAPAAALAAVLIAAGAGAASAMPTLLADSTVVDSWQLANGLKVTTHHVPGAKTVALTLGVPIGSGADPVERPGLARLAAEVEMMGAAGTVPERTRHELESLRPLGWTIKVARRLTQLSEVATPEQFPGVLRQMAMRLRGVTVTEPVLKAAAATVRREIGLELFGGPAEALYFQVGEYALGHDEKSILVLAEARGLSAVKSSDLQARLRRVFVPAHAVLAIAGDLQGMNLRTVLENEFGGIPAGDPLPAPPPPALKPSLRQLTRAEVDHPVGVVGVIAPALTDSLHPLFFLSLLLIGEHCNESWPVDRAVRRRFSYSILEEPELVRIFPAPPADSTEASVLQVELEAAMSRLMEMIIDVRQYDMMRYNVLWLLGGPMPDHVLAGVRSDGPALNTLCNAMASRELTGGEAFWSRYRDGFTLTRDPRLARWAVYVSRPENEVALLLRPRR